MWIVLPDALIIAHCLRDSDMLILESPIHGDIERFMPSAETMDCRGDIRWIAMVSQEDFAHALSQSAYRLDEKRLPYMLEDGVRRKFYMEMLSHMASEFGMFGSFGKEGRKMSKPNWSSDDERALKKERALHGRIDEENDLS